VEVQKEEFKQLLMAYPVKTKKTLFGLWVQPFDFSALATSACISESFKGWDGVPLTG